MSDVSIAYHGYLFDASGYGYAARAYIHALHTVGVEITAVELARRGRQVPDPLVESLLHRRGRIDLHFFHGIPPEWARHAFRLKNTVGMTVWETDAMPSQWRGPLNHVKDVWLPCEFNIPVFRAALETSVFRLPHPVPPGIDADAGGALPSSGVAPSDFVVYSIFEWQERKHPHGMIDAFLTAFADVTDAILVLKTNPGAAAVAARAVDEARGRIRSSARVEVHAAGWSESLIAALHRRGDCYLSLHRGEGWGYPLFEAAARGTPVVATAYSGPLDYLSPDEHALVNYRPVAVRQPYAYYSPRMQWADPDLAHAAVLLRMLYEDREGARARAAQGAARLRETFSLERVGAAGRDRLAALRDMLASGSRFPAHSTTRAALGAPPQPPVPIPADWYDADYFEHGTRSNWRHGYSWTLFAGLFRGVAEFLTETFPDAESFLDAGCAKGFLVRAILERQRLCTGFDNSAWAVEHAEAVARPHITRADVEEYVFQHDVDVLVALDLLSHLTEQQAEHFLRRARSHVRVALIATIALGEGSPSDRDRTHVTCRDREWWLTLFRRAGWQQDALHRMTEHVCQRHALPARMQWNVFLLSPGDTAQSTERRVPMEVVA